MKELWNKIKNPPLVWIRTSGFDYNQDGKVTGTNKMSKMLSKTLLKMSKRKQMRSRRK